MNRLLRTAATSLVTALSISGCGKFEYGVDIVNYGQSGVVLLRVGEHEGSVRKPYKVRGGNGEYRWVTYVAPRGLEKV
ncbi:hypothetical protein RM530_18475, partial [Algiphilus sp. W345]